MDDARNPVDAIRARLRAVGRAKLKREQADQCASMRPAEDRVRAEGHIRLPRALFRSGLYAALSRPARILLPILLLPVYRSQQGGYQSVRAMMKLSGLSKASVGRALEELRRLHIIRRERRGDGETALTMILPTEGWKMPSGERVLSRIQTSQNRAVWGSQK